MRFILAFLLLTTPAFAWGLGLHPNGWYTVRVDGWTFSMPPKVCTVGKIMPYALVYAHQAVMDNTFPHRPGDHVLGGFRINSYGAQIWIDRDVSPRVQAMNLIHEQAEARGCGDDPVDRKSTIQH